MGNRRKAVCCSDQRSHSKHIEGLHLESGRQHASSAETLAQQRCLGRTYWNNEPIEDLVDGLTAIFDRLIIDLWQHFGSTHGCALFAVGGYGRAELHPQSDIDIGSGGTSAATQGANEAFLRDVFDLNVEVGHSVRDVKTCVKECQVTSP